MRAFLSFLILIFCVGLLGLPAPGFAQVSSQKEVEASELPELQEGQESEESMKPFVDPSMDPNMKNEEDGAFLQGSHFRDFPPVEIQRILELPLPSQRFPSNAE